MAAREWWQAELNRLQHPDAEQRCFAINFLARSGSKPAFSGRRLAEEFAPHIEQCVTDPDGKVRAAAAMALGRFVIKHYAKAVAGLLNDSEGKVRGAAVWALGQMDARDYRTSFERLRSDATKFVIPDAARVVTIGELVKEILAKWDFMDHRRDTP